MIASVHLVDGGVRRLPRLLRATPSGAGGLAWGTTMLAAELGPSLLPRPHPGRGALVATWREPAALDAFEASPAAAPFAGGLALRLEPVRESGSWAAWGGSLVGAERPVPADEPVVVLTLGRLKPARALAFLRTSAVAEGAATTHPAFVAGTALARPPQVVCTLSLWESAAGMQDYAYRQAGHRAALTAVGERDFHAESTFVRFRLLAARGRCAGFEVPQAVRDRL